MQQVLAHFDRIQELYAQDPELLRAMFVATFEAVKTTSPLRDRVRTQLERRRGQGRRRTAKGHARTASVRRGIDIGRGGQRHHRGGLRHRVPVGGRAAPVHDLEAETRARTRRGSFGTTAAKPNAVRRKPLGDPLHRAGRTDVPDVAAVVPVQLAAPALVQRQRAAAASPSGRARRRRSAAAPTAASARRSRGSITDVSAVTTSDPIIPAACLPGRCHPTGAGAGRSSR